MPPRVLLLNYEYPPLGGGGANATFYLLKEFTELDIDIDLVTTSAADEFELDRLSDRVLIHKLPIKKTSLHYWTQREVAATFTASMRYAQKLVESKEFDLCHAFFTIPGGAIAYRLRRRLPYIVSLRGSDVPGFNPRFSLQYHVLKPAIRRIWGAGALVVANSSGLRELALETKADQSIEVIANGVDGEEFYPAETKGNSCDFNLICVNRLIGRKGIDLLIKALPLVREEVKEIKLTVVGEGNLEGQLKALALAEGVSGAVNWLGYVDHHELPGLYRAADLFVLPSQSEGMSNALLEAMASGLPVLVGAAGGVSELISGNGSVLDDLTPENIAKEIIYIAQNRSVGLARGERSRRAALAHSWRAAAGAYLRHYNEIANAAGRV